MGSHAGVGSHATYSDNAVLSKTPSSPLLAKGVDAAHVVTAG